MTILKQDVTLTGVGGQRPSVHSGLFGNTDEADVKTVGSLLDIYWNNIDASQCCCVFGH